MTGGSAITLIFTSSRWTAAWQGLSAVRFLAVLVAEELFPSEPVSGPGSQAVVRLATTRVTARSRIPFPVTRFLERFVAVLLLAWLPMQASALPALALLCEQEQTSAAKHDVSAAVHDHHTMAAHSHASDDDGAGGTGHDHGNGCCHHLFSAVVPASLDAPRESGSPLDLTPLFNLFSFFPEQPQRPPLT